MNQFGEVLRIAARFWYWLAPSILRFVIGASPIEFRCWHRSGIVTKLAEMDAIMLGLTVAFVIVVVTLVIQLAATDTHWLHPLPADLQSRQPDRFSRAGCVTRLFEAVGFFLRDRHIVS